jgi:acetylornithine deacetylase/succinyl-diaminopimelate desuccinylase family protein
MYEEKKMDEKLIRDISTYIDSKKDDLLETLGRYIQFHSINVEMLQEGETSEIAECQKWVARQLEGMGCFQKVDYYEMEEGRPNVVGLMEGSGGGRSLLFNSHSDVVTVSDEQSRAWTGLSPFDGGIKEGKVWGRGASDMKSGGTAMMYAVQAIKELGIRLKGDLYLTYVDGEESGRADIGIWSLIDRGYTADFGIMCEPTSMSIFNKSKGEIYFDIKISGQSTHICNRYKTIWPRKSKEERLGVNAIDKMVRLINAFAELERSWGLDYYDPDLDPGSTTLTVSVIRGGESFSAQAGQCEMTIASMFAPQLTVDDIKRQIIDTIDYVADHDYWLKDHRPEYSLPFPAKVPLNVAEDDPAVLEMKRSFEQVTGRPPNIGPSPFVGDMNYMFEKGVKCAVWGPGDIGLAHGTNEYVEIDQVLTAAKVYAATIVNWCGAVE